MKIIRFCVFLMLLSLFACQKDLPEPESKIKEIPNGKVVVASGWALTENDPFVVKHYIKGNNVYVECMIRNFSFRKSEDHKVQTGKMVVYIDGKKKQEFSSAAFILRDLPKGNHRITLQFINQNGQKTALKKELIITIL